MVNKTNFTHCFLLLLLLAFAMNVFAQTKTKGLIWEDTRYSSVERVGTGMKFTANEPVLSLKSYCPTPGSQGSIGSCVGWASGYAALTIAVAKKYNITDPAKLNSMAHSAMYIYNQVKVGGCNEGSRITDALDLLKNKGNCLLTDFNPRDCAVLPGNGEDQKALPYRIKDYATLFGIDDGKDAKIAATINSIASGKPVIIGMNIPSSFDFLRTEKWDSNLGNTDITGGHAMAIIGYNDYNKTFEIMNSWGTNWGKGGFCLISYDDFGNFVKYGYQFTLDERKNPEKDPVTLSGDFVFQQFQKWDDTKNEAVYEEVKPVLANNTYTLSKSPKVGDYFRLVAKNVRKDKYIYVFSIDPTNKVEILYPSDKAFERVDAATVKELPRVPTEKAEVYIPGGTKAIQTDKAGTDYLCILYSDKVIDNIQDLVVAVQTNKNPDFGERLKSGFGSSLMPQNAIQYASGLMSVKATSSSGYIVPIVLKAEVVN